MSFRIEIYEIESAAGTEAKGREVKRYEQVVEELDLRAVMAAVNQKKRGPRERKARVTA